MAAHALAFVAALFAVLPPGTCALVVSASAEQPTAHSCCRLGQESSTPAPDDTPHDCCCDRAAVVAERQTADTAVEAVLAPLPFAWQWGDLHRSPQADTFLLLAPFHSGPPVHLVKCVWRI